MGRTLNMSYPLTFLSVQYSTVKCPSTLFYSRSLELINLAICFFTFLSFFFHLPLPFSISLLQWPNLKSHHFNLINSCSTAKVSIIIVQFLPECGVNSKRLTWPYFTPPSVGQLFYIFAECCFSLRLCTTLYYNYLFIDSECRPH